MGNHETIERYERIWVGFSLVLIALFVTLVFFAVGMHGTHIGHAEPRQHPAVILASPEFSNPGVEETGPGRYTVRMVAQAFSFVPGELEFPAGAEVTFRMTSRDVIHGLLVKGTSINLELIPGDISTLTYTFDRPGEYRIICSQYCGIAHQNMLGMIRVVDPDAQPTAAAPAVDDAGRVAYERNCAACHQADGRGMPGVFPPLHGHAPTLLDRDGYLVDVVLYGLAGAIEVDGVTYRGLMPGMAQMSDADIAAAVNYILRAWGNDGMLPDGFAPMTADEVAARRGKGLTSADMLDRREAAR
jgi:cytochrome c oxidase subunit II